MSKNQRLQGRFHLRPQRKGFCRYWREKYLLWNELHASCFHLKYCVTKQDSSWVNIRKPSWFTLRTEDNYWWAVLTLWDIIASSTFTSTTMSLLVNFLFKRQNVIIGRITDEQKKKTYNSQEGPNKLTTHPVQQQHWMVLQLPTLMERF